MRFGRTGTGKWHIVGPDGCRYGRAFADDPEAAPDETTSAADIVSYAPPDDVTDGIPSDRVLGSGTRLQRLVLPGAITESDAELCRSCRSRLETHQRRRSQLIEELKRATPARDVDWVSAESDSPPR